MRMHDYMLDHPMENLFWCKPYANDNLVIVLCENEIIRLQAMGKDYEVTSDSIHNAARISNPDYDLYSGYSDREILLMGDVQEIGCVDCPWFNQCEAMDMEEVEKWQE